LLPQADTVQTLVTATVWVNAAAISATSLKPAGTVVWPEGRIGYEQARLVARCRDPKFVEAWIAKAEAMTCIELARAVEADEERQLCAREELRLVLPRRVSALLGEACCAVRAAEARLVPTSEALVIIARHFIEVWKEP